MGPTLAGGREGRVGANRKEGIGERTSIEDAESEEMGREDPAVPAPVWSAAGCVTLDSSRESGSLHAAHHLRLGGRLYPKASSEEECRWFLLVSHMAPSLPDARSS